MESYHETKPCHIPSQKTPKQIKKKKYIKYGNICTNIGFSTFGCNKIS